MSPAYERNKTLDIVVAIFIAGILAFSLGTQYAQSWTGTTNTLSDGALEVEDLNITSGIYWNSVNRTQIFEGDYTGINLTTDSIDADEIVNTGRDLSQMIELTEDVGWCWFAEPRAVQYNGVTYTGGVKTSGDVVAISYDHATGDINETVLHSDLDDDDHASPSVLIEDDGTITYFYSKHGDSTGVRYRESTNPEDISSFETEQNISTTSSFSYPTPIQFSDGLIRVYGRGLGAVYFGYIESGDDKSTWENETDLGLIGYNKIRQEGDILHFGITTGSHPRNTDTGITYMKYVYSTDTYYDSNGTDLGSLPVDINSLTQIWNRTVYDRNAWIWDVHIDGSNPVVLFATFPYGEPWIPHEYYYGKWGGTEWSVNKITDGGSFITNDAYEQQYSSGLSFDSENPSIVYASIGDNRYSAIYKFETSDDGETWSYVQIVGAQRKNIRPVSPIDYNSEMKLLWLRGWYTSYLAGYNTSIMASDGTPTTSVEMPSVSQRFDFMCQLTTDTQSLADGSWTNIEWNSTNIDRGDFWDDGQTNLYDIWFPRCGWYRIHYYVRINNISANAVVELEDWASGIIVDIREASSGENVTLTGTLIRLHSTDDRTVLRVRHDSGSTENIVLAEATLEMIPP